MATAADEELLDEYEDDSDDEGIYEDEEDIFDDEGKVDHRNPVITREHEQAQVYDIKSGAERAGGNIVKSGRRQLVARMDKRGKWYVNTFVDGKAIAKWRAPTVEEAKKLDTKGRVVRGGVVDDDEHDDEDGDEVDLGEDEVKNGLPTWAKVGLGILGLGVVAGGGFWVYKKIKSDDDAEVDEVED